MLLSKHYPKDYARGDQSRIDKDALASEIEAGRKLADYIIDSSQSTEQCIKQITKIIC